MGRHWLPWRPNYDVCESSVEDCEDPDRVIVFDDLSSALFGVESTLDHFCLLCRFLDFLARCLPSSGLKQPNFIEEPITDFGLWWKTGEAFPDADSSAAFSEFCLSESELDRLCTFVENVYTQTVGLFEGDLRTALTLRYMHFKMTTVLSQTNAADRRRRKHAEKDVRQFFKLLLKQDHNRSNLAAWERYAHFEWEIGNYDDSRRVLEMALAMAGLAVNAENSRFPVIRLYETYSYLELGLDKLNMLDICSDGRKAVLYTDQQKRSKRVLRILAMAVNGYQANSVGTDITPADIVRARHFYQRKLDDVQASFLTVVSSCDTERIKHDGRSLLDWTVCFAWFQLLTVGLQSAVLLLENFETTLRKLWCRSSTTAAGMDLHVKKTADVHVTVSENLNVTIYRELLQIACRQHIQMAQFHLSSFSTPLNVVRTTLMDSLAEFPDNVWFLKTFIDLELRSHISGRLREYFHLAVNQATTPLPVLYAILAERKRLLRLSANGQVPCKLDVMLVDLFVNF